MVKCDSCHTKFNVDSRHLQRVELRHYKLGMSEEQGDVVDTGVMCRCPTCYSPVKARHPGELQTWQAIYEGEIQ